MVEILISDNYSNNSKKSNFSSLGIFELEMRDGIQLFPIDYNVLDDINLKNKIKAIKIVIKSTYGENKTYINQIMFYENTAKEIISFNENENENELTQSQNESYQKELNLPGDLSNSQISEEEKGQQIEIKKEKYINKNNFNEHNKNIKKSTEDDEVKENIKVEENNDNNINNNANSNKENNSEEVENEENSDDIEENKILSSSDELKEPQLDNYKKRNIKNRDQMRHLEKKQNLKKINNNCNTKSKKVRKIEKILKENILNNEYKKMNENEAYMDNLNHNRTQDFEEYDDKYNSKYNYNKHRTINNVDDYPSLTPLIKKKYHNENNYNISNRNSNADENDNIQKYFKISEPTAKSHTVVNGYEYLINKRRPYTPNMREVKRNTIPVQNKLLDEYKNRTTMNGFSHISNINDNNTYETLEMQLQDMEQYLKNMALNKDINSNSNYSKSNREEQIKENNYYNNDIYINNNFIDKKSKHQSFISNNSNYKNHENYEPKDLNTNNINYNNNEELKYNSENINMNNEDDSIVNRRIDNLEKNIFEIKNALNDISSNLKVFLDKETFLYNFRDSIKQICYDFFSSRISNINNEENNIYSEKNARINNEIENENEDGNHSQYSGDYTENKDNQNENRKIEEEINKKIDEKLEYLCDNLQNQIFEKYLQPSINEIEKSMKQNIEDIKEKVDSINCTNISVKKNNNVDESQNSNKYNGSSYLKYKNYSQISNNDIFNNNSSIIKKEKCEEINRLGEKLYRKLLEKEKKLKILKQETNMLMSIKNSQNNLNDDN